MKCQQKCLLDTFFKGDKEGLRCYACDRTFIEVDLDNPTVKELEKYREKQGVDNDLNAN